MLGGSLTINGRTYGEFAYAHLPAGYQRADMSAPDGAVVLTFFSGAPAFVAGNAAAGSFDERRLVEYADGLYQLYDNDFERMGSADVNIDGIALKLLREDPDNREQTWLLGAVANWPGGAVEIHPVVEEMYLVSGEIVGNIGSMKSGAYFWRPPGVRHGPFATREACVHFFRTKGGPLSTVFEEPEIPFRWQPSYPYKPILPAALAEFGTSEWQGPRDTLLGDGTWIALGLNSFRPKYCPGRKASMAPGRADVDTKVLSEDAGLGEATVIVRYPRRLDTGRRRIPHSR